MYKNTTKGNGWACFRYYGENMVQREKQRSRIRTVERDNLSGVFGVRLNAECRSNRAMWSDKGGCMIYYYYYNKE